MATRCITTVRSRWDQGEWRTHAVIYRHWDGYPTGQGVWLAEFLDGMHVINGIPLGEAIPDKYANGPGRLAAQIVTAMEKDGESPSLEPMTPDADYDQEFEYEVNVEFGMSGGSISVNVYSCYADWGNDVWDSEDESNTEDTGDREPQPDRVNNQCPYLLFSGSVEGLKAYTQEGEDKS